MAASRRVRGVRVTWVSCPVSRGALPPSRVGRKGNLWTGSRTLAGEEDAVDTPEWEEWSGSSAPLHVAAETLHRRRHRALRHRHDRPGGVDGLQPSEDVGDLGGLHLTLHLLHVAG